MKKKRVFYKKFLSLDSIEYNNNKNKVIKRRNLKKEKINDIEIKENKVLRNKENYLFKKFVMYL